MRYFSRLFCGHKETQFVRNIYGDEINWKDARSLHRCKKCGAIVKSWALYTGKWASHMEGAINMLKGAPVDPMTLQIKMTLEFRDELVKVLEECRGLERG